MNRANCAEEMKTLKVGDIVKRTVARNLKAAREDCHLTQAEAARIVGMTPQAISNYERGINSVDNKTLLKLCNAYGISPNRVLMDDIDTLPEKSNTIPSNVSTDYLLGQEKTSAPLPDAEALRVEEVMEAFYSAGLVPRGQDLTDEDLRFLLSVVAALRQWFGGEGGK